MTALDLLRQSLTPSGFVASPEDTTNYRRVWARDGVICGLAGLASDDDDLADGLRQTLQTLADHLGPEGQVPSNVDAEAGRASYGGLAGRVDAGPWFVLGVALYARVTGDRAFAARMAPAVSGAFRLLRAWEFNARGLVYVPQSGDWADEYDLHGYLLFDQALRVLALRAWAPLANGDAGRDADRLAGIIERTFWPRPDGAPDRAYHPAAYRRQLTDGAAPFPFAALTPGGYVPRFDALGSAVAVLAGLWADRRGDLLDYGLDLARRHGAALVPAFHPPVEPGDPGWEVLQANVRDRFSNAPGHYHNGGGWPMVAGWWAAALAESGRLGDARRMADATERANAAGGFPEYLDAQDGRPHGVAPLAWSAAGEVIARAAVEGRLSDWWAPATDEPGPPAPTTEAAEVVVAGEILVDLLSAEPADDLGDAVRFERHAGGSAANLASNLGRLGVPTSLVACVGDDGLGRFLTHSVEQTGVQSRVRVVADSPTSLATVTRTSGTPDFALYRQADRRLSPDQLPDSLLGGAQLFHTSGYALSRDPARTTLLDAAGRAARLGVTLSVDLNVAPRSSEERGGLLATTRTLLALSPLVKVSRDDAARLFGETLDDDEAVGQLRSLGARLVCLTRGAEGALVVWDEGRADVSADPIETVADATGAGDAFWAGFLAAWLRGKPPGACAMAGGRLAAMKLACAGPLPHRVSLADVLAPR